MTGFGGRYTFFSLDILLLSYGFKSIKLLTIWHSLDVYTLCVLFGLSVSTNLFGSLFCEKTKFSSSKCN